MPVDKKNIRRRRITPALGLLVQLLTFSDSVPGSGGPKGVYAVFAAEDYESRRSEGFEEALGLALS